MAVIFKKKNLFLTARHVSILAFIFVFPTILFGVMDWLHFFKGALIPPIKAKMILASCVLLLLGAGIILGSEVKVRSAPMMVIYALAVVGVVGLGWFGARLVYGNWAGSQAATEAAAPAAPPRAAREERQRGPRRQARGRRHRRCGSGRGFLRRTARHATPAARMSWCLSCP